MNIEITICPIRNPLFMKAVISNCRNHTILLEFMQIPQILFFYRMVKYIMAYILWF